MLTSLPLYGTALILATMVLAGYTFFISVLAGSRNSVRDLQAARLGAYGTVALIVTTVLLLAYAFVSHDFRIRYVAAHSDRSMPTYYLLTALWGGQDGSLLWWMFLLSVYIAACVKSLGTRVARLQPYIIATLMVVVMFFTVLMTFSANPFSTSISVRAGVRQPLEVETGAIWSLGAGAQVGFLRVDVARELHPVLNATNHVGVGTSFHFNPSRVRIESFEVSDIYLSLYRSYADRPIGSARLRNLSTEPVEVIVGLEIPGLGEEPTTHPFLLEPGAGSDVPLSLLLPDRVTGRAQRVRGLSPFPCC